ncbi:MAG: FAD-dependent oxidoreductase [Planctomycetota bacterium]
MELTEHLDLRGGSAPWTQGTQAPTSDALPTARVDVAIIGAGIMGSMLADRLSEAGHRVALLDRRPPAQGSTAASTALVMWEMDVSLSKLAERIGEVEAVRRWRRVHETVVRLGQRIEREKIDAARIPRPVVLLAGTLMDESGLAVETNLRRKHGLPSQLYAPDAVALRFAIPPRAAIVSDDNYEVDPVRLMLSLLERARRRGATLTYPIDVNQIVDTGSSIELRSQAGVVVADHAILATGYERAREYLPRAFVLSSSFAVASSPGVAPRWGENAMLWEASDPYLYVRADSQGRILAGGEDEKFQDASRRDALIATKARRIVERLEGMIGGARVRPECEWAALFGGSPDGLPGIGQAAKEQRLWLAAGFGGNGVSFAALAAELLAAELAGRPDPDSRCFDPYRFE